MGRKPIIKQTMSKGVFLLSKRVYVISEFVFSFSYINIISINNCLNLTSFSSMLKQILSERLILLVNAFVLMAFILLFIVISLGC